MREVTLKDVPCTPGHCLLHWFPHTSKTKVTSRFQDLALVLAKSEITRNWKSSTGPELTSWRKELLKWAGFEGVILMMEAKRGRGCLEVARAWEALIDDT